MGQVAASLDKHLRSPLSRTLCKTRKEWMTLDVKKPPGQWRRYYIAISLTFCHRRPTQNSVEVGTISSDTYVFVWEWRNWRWQSVVDLSKDVQLVFTKLKPRPGKTIYHSLWITIAERNNTLGDGGGLSLHTLVQFADILQSRKYMPLWRTVINHFNNLKWDQNRYKENHNPTQFQQPRVLTNLKNISS